MTSVREYVENPRGRAYRVVQTSVIRDPRLEQRVMDENRERMMYYVMFAGLVLFAYALL